MPAVKQKHKHKVREILMKIRKQTTAPKPSQSVSQLEL